jgi:hypothetical protein
VARQPLTFFASPKESKQRKASARRLPFGFPLKKQVKREVKQTRLRLRQVSLLIRFACFFNGSLQAQFKVVIQKRNSTARPYLKFNNFGDDQ